MLKAENRLKGQAEFSRILKEGRRVRGQFLLVASAAKSGKAPRFGVVVSKKVAKRAVDRNRLRRIITHLLGHALADNSNMPDVVVMITRKPETTAFAALEQDIHQWQRTLPSS